jgi:hypothetical protein
MEKMPAPTMPPTPIETAATIPTWPEPRLGVDGTGLVDLIVMVRLAARFRDEVSR